MHQTSSLAQWFDHDDGPTQLEEIEAPAVMATPASVAAYGINNTVMVLHMAEGFLAVAGVDDEIKTEERFSFDDLACLVWQLPRLAMACSDPDNPEEELAFRTLEGISVERVEPGLLALGFCADDSVKIHLPAVMAWQLVTELTALMIRQMIATADAADRLESTLQQSR